MAAWDDMGGMDGASGPPGWVAELVLADDLLRPVPLQAFPLPSELGRDEGRFRLLLQALAERSRAAN